MVKKSQFTFLYRVPLMIINPEYIAYLQLTLYSPSKFSKIFIVVTLISALRAVKTHFEVVEATLVELSRHHLNYIEENFIPFIFFMSRRILLLIKGIEFMICHEGVIETTEI